jgi:ribosome assembly protein RRB1
MGKKRGNASREELTQYGEEFTGQMQESGERPSKVKDLNSRAIISEDLDYEDPIPDEIDQDVPMEGIEEQLDEKQEAAESKPRVWIPQPGVDAEELEYDSRAYKVYHKLNMEWPCLSFDILQDKHGQMRTKFPMTMYFAAGSQAESSGKNKVSVFKVFDIYKTKYDDEESEEDENLEEDSESDDDMDGDPMIEERSFRHEGAVNRLRAAPQAPHVIATWSETGKVHVWNTQVLLDSLDAAATERIPTELKPVCTFAGHQEEGFAMDWSPVAAGRLLSGDCLRFIHLWEPRESTWEVERSPFRGHLASVEDIQWSPTQKDVFASCGVDRTIRIWDARARNSSILTSENAHDSDINVISWNRIAAHLLVSGSDDSSFKIWDLRAFKENKPAGIFTWHKKPITAIQWHPCQESIMAVSSEDDSISIWDMSLEHDPEATATGADMDQDIELPPQLLFLHQGQKDIKELRFHPQIPGIIMSASFDGMNLFKPDNLVL